ncbi:MAG: hypothetical protein AAFU34_20770, partial [Pseudomonadota bacterium]
MSHRGPAWCVGLRRSWTARAMKGVRRLRFSVALSFWRQPNRHVGEAAWCPSFIIGEKAMIKPTWTMAALAAIVALGLTSAQA